MTDPKRDLCPVNETKLALFQTVRNIRVLMSQALKCCAMLAMRTGNLTDRHTAFLNRGHATTSRQALGGSAARLTANPDRIAAASTRMPRPPPALSQHGPLFGRNALRFLRQLRGVVTRFHDLECRTSISRDAPAAVHAINKSFVRKCRDRAHERPVFVVQSAQSATLVITTAAVCQTRRSRLTFGAQALGVVELKHCRSALASGRELPRHSRSSTLWHL